MATTSNIISMRYMNTRKKMVIEGRKVLLPFYLLLFLPLTALAQVTVSTTNGKVSGIDQEGTMAFLGIPYAKVERFMPPQPVEKWQGVRA